MLTKISKFTTFLAILTVAITVAKYAEVVTIKVNPENYLRVTGDPGVLEKKNAVLMDWFMAITQKWIGVLTIKGKRR